jgi:3-dehydroquinate dehydratase
MTNKNPYEIRLDVLKMAQDMLEAEQRIKELKFTKKIETLRAVKHNEEAVLSYIDQNAPVAYTPEEVIARSSTLYNFVSSTSLQSRDKK